MVSDLLVKSLLKSVMKLKKYFKYQLFAKLKIWNKMENLLPKNLEYVFPYINFAFGKPTWMMFQNGQLSRVKVGKSFPI